MPHPAFTIVTMAASTALGVAAFRKRPMPGAGSLLALSVALLVWSASLPAVVADGAGQPLLVTLLLSLITISMLTAATAVLTFAISVTRWAGGLSPRILGWFAVVPALVQVIVWSAADGTRVLAMNVGRPSMILSAKPWYPILLLYCLSLVAAGSWMLAGAYVRTRSRPPARRWTMMAGALIPVAILSLELAYPDISLPLQAGYGAFLLCGLGFGYGLLAAGRAGLIPVAREEVIDQFQDGLIILDPDDRITDINPSAENLLGIRRREVLGQEIRSVIADFPAPGRKSDAVQELEMRRSSTSQETWRYLSVRIAPLTDRAGAPLGRLVVWSDNTKQRLAEDARHRARDEMFVLLNAISSAASHTIQLEDFLSEATYQIIYPFRSQLVAIFLQDDTSGKNEEARLYLASHLGLTEDMAESLAYLPLKMPLVEWLMTNRHPLSIEDLAGDARTPAGLQGRDFSCLLVSPLVAPEAEQAKVIGLLFLARKDESMFSEDELVRVAAVSDQIAMLVDSSRRRKLDIAVSERRSLMRDLHDSVSQRLYGLVAITEAAQAALEAGEKVDPPELFARIGEHARQAVREMRLFLYQARPIDVEKDGIISVLHHRLAAVEGRANLKARLLADEDIPLSKDKEVALYFICQEALNNIMKHAYARSVLVTLKRGKQNVILEVKDDGKGFDPKKADPNGLGLRNMRERTAQIGGTLKVVSKPGQGTRIVIKVPAARTPRAVARRRSK